MAFDVASDCLGHGFYQINWNLLQYKDHKDILFSSTYAFWYVLSDKNLINCSAS